MLSPKIEKALNAQINAEYFSAYLYHSMAAHFENQSFKGFANWMQVQAQEELAHGRHIYDYVMERGGQVKLTAIDAPPIEWNSFLEVFQEVYAHEVKVTKMIHALVDLALEEKDHATYAFLQWYVDEQVEEEASADEMVQMLKFIGSETGPIFSLDRELATRVFVPPFADE